MIVTQLYKGQGLGNQLWCYVTTRVIALKNGYAFGIQSPENFKGIDFMNIDFGCPVVGGNGPEGGPPLSLPQDIVHYYQERKIAHPNGADIRIRDENLTHVPDNTKIDGLMQDVEYIADHKNEIREWLSIGKEFDCYEYSSDDICVINFRGGGYVREKDFFLRPEYWQHAITNMLTIYPTITFVVITDDVKTAKGFFPDYDVFHFSIAKDYSIIQNARYLILSNSSFAWFPAWLSTELRYCIAPKYWGRHNISNGYWSLGYNITPGWMYQDRDGVLHDYESCIKERDEYMEAHADEFIVETKFDATKPYATTPPPGTVVPPFAKRIRRKIDTAKVLFVRRRKEASLFEALIDTAALLVANEKFAYRLKKLARIIISVTGISFVVGNIAESWKKRDWKSPAEIVAYRKTIKIYDVFSFFNELDLLEIRLNILDPYVDYFVIVEATETFSGHPKPLYFKENKERFKKWEHKIIHHVIDDTPKDENDLRNRLYRGNLSRLERQIITDSLTSDNIGKGDIHWFKEFYQKESIKKALTDLSDDDVCYVSDLDEIWNPELTIDYAKDDVFKPIQTGYQYYFNNRSNEDWRGWTGTIVTKYKNIKYHCLNHLRTHRKMQKTYTFLGNGGWHFAFQGGYAGAKRKIKEYNHSWYRPEEILPRLKERISSNKDHRGRKIKLWKDERGLPKFLLENKQKYITFFR